MFNYIISEDLLTKCSAIKKFKKTNIITEKPGKHHLNKVIKVNTTSNDELMGPQIGYTEKNTSSLP